MANREMNGRSNAALLFTVLFTGNYTIISNYSETIRDGRDFRFETN